MRLNSHSYLLDEKLVGARLPYVDVEYDSVLATSKKAVRRVSNQCSLIYRAAVLCKLLR